MTSKSNNLFMRITALSMLDILYFLWQPYPKSILLRTVCESGGRSDLITNIIFFIIQFFVLRKVFLNEHAKERRRFAFRGVAAFFAIICVQLMCDAALINTYDQQYFLFPIVCNVCSIVQWIMIFLIMTWAYPDKRRRWNKTRAKWCIIAIAAAFLATAMVILLEQKQLNYLFEKFKEGSWRLDGYLTNARFKHQRLNMFMSMAASISICTAVYFKVWKRDESDRPIVYYIGQWLMRAMFVVFAVGLLRFGKMILLPQSTLMAYNSGNNVKAFSVQNSYEDIRISKFELNNTHSEAIRFNNNMEMETIYCETLCHVLYCGKKIYTFVYTGFNPATGRTNTKIKHLNEYSAAIFAKEELAWAENDRVHHINIHDIDKQKENEALIKICERMVGGVDTKKRREIAEYYYEENYFYLICAGDWDFFECTAGYLLKYDPDFIIPYIERYAAGKFTDDELKENSTIRPEFIQAIAQNLLAQIEK